MAKVKAPRVDGFGPEDLKKLRDAVRKVWHWSYPKRLCVARATGPDGFAKCEMCSKIVPKITVDHKIPVGSLRDPGWVDRLFCPSEWLQALCKKCHADKTKADNAATKKKK